MYLQNECIEKYQFELCPKMIESMILTSYSDESYLVPSGGEYVARIQIMLRNKLKHQVSQQFLLNDK